MLLRAPSVSSPRSLQKDHFVGPQPLDFALHKAHASWSCGAAADRRCRCVAAKSHRSNAADWAADHARWHRVRPLRSRSGAPASGPVVPPPLFPSAACAGITVECQAEDPRRTLHARQMRRPAGRSRFRSARSRSIPAAGAPFRRTAPSAGIRHIRLPARNPAPPRRRCPVRLARPVMVRVRIATLKRADAIRARKWPMAPQ